MAVSKQPNLSPEISNAEGLDEETTARGETRWKKYHPFRVVRKIFRRRIKREGTSVSEASKKSWSTSELQSVQDERPGKREVTSPLKIGLSVSHDSIFSPESNPAAVSSETLDVPHGSSLSMHHTAIKNMFKDELFSRVRARRDSDDDDVGLPHSPCTSPTTVDVLTQGLKEKISKSKTTCSVGSLLSMGSSENDEDSAGHSSGHSSRMSLIDRRSLDSDGDADSSPSIPLNHNAARHRIAVKPKRTYGAPRRRMNQIAAEKVNKLPSTPEVTEDSGKMFQKLESTEIVKTFTEHSSSLIQISSKQQTESFFSFAESSGLHKDSVAFREKVFSESSSQNVIDNIECNSKALSDEIMKKMRTGSSANEYEYNKSQTVLKETNFAENVRLENAAILSKHIPLDISDKVQKYLPSEQAFPTIISETSNQTESVLKVSSLVKSLEKSESFKKSDWHKRSRKEITPLLRDDQTRFSPNSDISKQKDELNYGESNDPEFHKCTDHLKKSVDFKAFKDEGDKTFHQELVSDSKSLGSQKKLDINTEFVLKPPKRDYNINPVEKQDFPKMKLSSPISPVLFEGTDANKSLSVTQESNIFVKTRTSPRSKQNITVTEACNFVAVEDSAEFVPCTQNIDAQPSSLAWIGSLDMPSTLINFGSDVTINSASSICKKHIVEDKITVSVNLKSETKRTVSPVDKESTSQMSEVQKPFMLPKTVSNEKPKEPNKLAQKFPANDSTNSANFRVTNAQKRVSVEIVPFSQRAKEKKYDPTCNKEQSLDQSKKNTNASIERKLSDRKTPPKTKETEKNRHSFSGVAEKKTESEYKPIKTDKSQYPVQIRVQKAASKSEVKEKTSEFKTVSNRNSSTDVKFQGQSTKQQLVEMKTTKQDRNLSDKTAKWEVKIQNSSSIPLSSQMSFEANNAATSEESNTPETNDTHKLTSVSGVSKEVDVCTKSTPVSKGNDPNWKNSKDVPSTTSDEPEPELLRVFARRSIKHKCDKGKSEQVSEVRSANESAKDPPATKSEENKGPLLSNRNSSNDVKFQVQTTKPQLAEMKTTKQDRNLSDKSPVVTVAETQKHILKTDLKKKSRSFSEKEKTRAISPLREMNLIRRESFTKVSPDTSLSSETVHPRQRLASVPDIPVNLPPETSSTKDLGSGNCNKDTPKCIPTVPSSISNSNSELLKENEDLLGDKDMNAPSWLQLAQQRRELREQRERILLGGPTNSFMDGSSKPSRSSKVWDMVNNFQKLQMT